MKTMDELLATLPQVGRVTWIGLRTERRGDERAVAVAEAVAGQGLVGDHGTKPRKGKRQLSLIQHEHLAAVGGLLGLPPLDPATLRRQVVISGLNLLALKGRRFRVGGALLSWSGTCDPCSRMEEALGPGGYNALRGHGGVVARIEGSGKIRVGDPVWAVDDDGLPAEPPNR